MHLILAPGVLENVIRHLTSELPNEGCGLLVGAPEMATRFVPVRNRLSSPTEFDMDPAELIAALRSLRETGEHLLAICHSHPQGPAAMSGRDITRAYYPQAAHIIVSMESPESPVVRGFRVADAVAVEIELRVIV